MKIKKISGFTLFETMIVMSVAALLISLGIFTYVQSSKTSRDTTRKADLQTISNALEKYKSDEGTYPLDISYEMLKKYLSNIPTDPNTNEPYSYSKTPEDCGSIENPCTSYILGTTLEIGSLYEIDKYGLH